MKFKNLFILISVILIAILSINSVVAINENVNNNNLTSDSSFSEVKVNNDKLSVSNDDFILMESKTISIDDFGETHREMNDHTIRNAIQNASAGDTIIINGQNYDHVHLVIDKQLTIKSNVGTTLSHCSNQGVQDSGFPGIFYITSQASGTVIEGFNFNNDDGVLYNNDGYSIFINGASNVIIRNCNISNNNVGDAIRIENSKNTMLQNLSITSTVNAVKIKNSENIIIKESIICNSGNGICDINSTKTNITLNNISDNTVGISVEESSNNPIISFNNIFNNKNGIELTSSDNINILSNYIGLNTDYGVYINCKVVKINIIGNFFYQNSKRIGEGDGAHIFNDKNTKGIWQYGGEQLEVTNNNYMVGIGERPVYRDGSVGAGVFLGYTFEINENVNCPVIYFNYSSQKWYEGDYRLQLSEISQSKKGIYSISIVDSQGNVAKGLSSVPVIFYLNKNNNFVSPQEGDIYKTVMMVDGTATVRFYADDFKQSGNVLTAVLPGTSNYLTGDQNKNVKMFSIDDNSIPGNISSTKIAISNLNTIPNSNTDFTITLTDIYNNPVINESVIFNINSKNIITSTNSKGQATIKINQNPGVYIVKVTYAGDDSDYAQSSAQAKITVSKISTKLIASNYVMINKRNGYYSVTLKDSFGNALSNQKIIFNINKKTYVAKTNNKGVAKVKLTLKKGSYKIQSKFSATNKYSSVKKTNKIIVKKSLKTKLTASKITTTPKTSTKYLVTLSNENGEGISKQKVYIKINGKNYSKKTNSKGQVYINVKLSKIKSYKVNVNYKGNNIYKKSSTTGKIIIQKISTKITLPVLNSFPNTLNDYTVTLKTIDGKALPKQSVKINLNGQNYLKTTNNNGQVSIQIKFPNENTYKATVSYGGNTIYKNSNAVGVIKISRIQTQLESYNKTFSNDNHEIYTLSLKDSLGNALSNQLINYTLNNQSYLQNTDVTGQIKVNISSLTVGSHVINAIFAQSNQYKSSISSNMITILDKNGVTFIDKELPNSEIQNRLNEAVNDVEFLGDAYNDVNLIIDKSLNFIFPHNTTLNGKYNYPVLTISASNLNISNLKIVSNESSGIIIVNANNVSLENNNISNNLMQSKISKYNSGQLIMPGDGICILNASDVLINNNEIRSFANAIFTQNSGDLELYNNTLLSSNYGINYGIGVKNTQIKDNLISNNIGLYVMDVPEGSLGYGVFLNQSAVNVSIIHNNISNNYMGISIDSNYSTGIIITNNLICDNALEGIRFNAGYDLAENAVEPNVNDNAIYRNAKGPSMMILGELSANPEGIYQYGPDDDSKKLQLGANWYGKNSRVTWDNDNNITGYGTMCPRINTTYISVGEIEVVKPGSYSITFYKFGEVASSLPKFEMYATLNDVEISFDVVDGIGTFSFNSSDFNNGENVIKVSIGSLNDQYRTFEVLLNKTVDSSEIPS